MSDKEFNIKSSTIEKGLDLVGGFLGKLVNPSIEELGSIIALNFSVWKFKKQVKYLQKTEKYVIENNISVKSIPIKILFPLLENYALEEDKDIIRMWEDLLINYIDSSKTFNAVIYPKILSELSSSEAKFLKSLDAYLLNTKESVQNYELQNIPLLEHPALNKISKPELSNLIRLGILKETYSYKDPKPYGVLSRSRFDENSPKIKISLTDLGKEFIQVCKIN